MNKVFKESDVRNSTLEYFEGDELATNVWISKYALRNKEGDLLEKTPYDMFNRLTEEIYRAESKYKNPLEKNLIKALLQSKTIIPGGSALFGIGNKYVLSSLANCFVVGSQEDSYGSICKIDEEQVQLMKRRKLNSAS